YDRDKGIRKGALNPWNMGGRETTTFRIKKIFNRVNGSCQTAYLSEMKIFLTLILSMGLISLSAQKTIDLKEVSLHVGDSVLVTGKVYSTRYLETAQGGPTLLNLGAAYPDQLLTLVIYAADRPHFPEAPESYFRDKTVRVTGKVVLFRNKPQIVISQAKEIEIISDKKE
ncbi:MAG: hypothetical protein ACXVB3_13005, partial [Flavisolibacter sp.]